MLTKSKTSATELSQHLHNVKMGEALVKAVSDPIDNCSKYVLNDCESSCGFSNCFSCDVKTHKVDLEEESEEIT